MAKFKKKPVVIEAVQLRWDTWPEVCEHAGVGELAAGKPQGCWIDREGKAHGIQRNPEDKMGLWIPTLEGLMIATERDWIIRGVKGELYPCKPDIFEQTYEPAE